jgi:hypothetical protein
MAYQVAYIENSKEFYEDVMLVDKFDKEEDAIDCLVDCYIDFLLEMRDFVNIDSGYHYYNYPKREWVPIDIVFLRKYLKTCKIYKDSVIHQYIKAYDKWIRSLT